MYLFNLQFILTLMSRTTSKHALNDALLVYDVFISNT